MDKLLHRLRSDYPHIQFIMGEKFYWSPKNTSISYHQSSDHTNEELWALLHEVGHAIHGHSDYESDLELIRLESQAWETAKQLAETYGYSIDASHIEDCMDTYRDWLHQRSACPVCSTRCLQRDAQHYHCYNCGQVWSVTSSRFCRPYRRKETKMKKSPNGITTEATFS